MSAIYRSLASRLTWQRFATTLFVLSIVGLASTHATAQHYRQTNLVSDIRGMARTFDPNLVDPWGLTRSQTSPWWVANNCTGTSTLYNGAGQRFPLPPAMPLVVTIPGANGQGTPTGTVFSGTSDFALTPNTPNPHPALFIFVGEDGTISGWNPGVDPTHAIIKSNLSGSLFTRA